MKSTLSLQFKTKSFEELNMKPKAGIIKNFYKFVESDTFTLMAIKLTYDKIAMEDESIIYKAFICEFSLYEYMSMPMGIKSALVL